MIFVQDAFFLRNLTKHFFFKVLIAFYLMILYNDTGIKRSFDTYDSWEFTFFVCERIADYDYHSGYC